MLKTINRLTLISSGVEFDDTNLHTMSTNKFISSCINKRYPVTRYIMSNIYKYMVNYKFPCKTNSFEEFMEYNI